MSFISLPTTVSDHITTFLHPKELAKAAGTCWTLRMHGKFKEIVGPEKDKYELQKLIWQAAHAPVQANKVKQYLSATSTHTVVLGDATTLQFRSHTNGNVDASFKLGMKVDWIASSSKFTVLNEFKEAFAQANESCKYWIINKESQTIGELTVPFTPRFSGDHAFDNHRMALFDRNNKTISLYKMQNNCKLDLECPPFSIMPEGLQDDPPALAEMFLTENFLIRFTHRTPFYDSTTGLIICYNFATQEKTVLCQNISENNVRVAVTSNGVYVADSSTISLYPFTRDKNGIEKQPIVRTISFEQDFTPHAHHIQANEHYVLMEYLVYPQGKTVSDREYVILKSDLSEIHLRKESEDRPYLDNNMLNERNSGYTTFSYLPTHSDNFTYLEKGHITILETAQMKIATLFKWSPEEENYSLQVATVPVAPFRTVFPINRPQLTMITDPKQQTATPPTSLNRRRISCLRGLADVLRRIFRAIGKWLCCCRRASS